MSLKPCQAGLISIHPPNCNCWCFNGEMMINHHFFFAVPRYQTNPPVAQDSWVEHRRFTNRGPRRCQLDWAEVAARVIIIFCCTHVNIANTARKWSSKSWLSKPIKKRHVNHESLLTLCRCVVQSKTVGPAKMYVACLPHFIYWILFIYSCCDWSKG